MTYLRRKWIMPIYIDPAISTCRKQKVLASEALNLLFRSQLPEIFNTEVAEYTRDQ